jgi:ubiquinone biosynthesis protein UbiJ
MTPSHASDSPESRIHQAIAAAAEFALNSALSLDPYTRRRWAALHGKIIAIDARGVKQTFTITVDADCLRVAADHSGAADVRIAGAPLALAKLTGPRVLRSPALAQEVTFTGLDADVREVRALIEGFEIDWEEHLSRVVGDVVAHQVGNAVRGMVQWLETSSKALLSDAGEYVRFEADQVPSPSELTRFAAEVEELRRRVATLDERVRRLSA